MSLVLYLLYNVCYREQYILYKVWILKPDFFMIPMNFKRLLGHEFF